ncbi:MAG: hypothetical protein HQL67_06095 [Magnetococcales bacterium]|nr:hypothetical protein [Magnetococcales bacterium]
MDKETIHLLISRGLDGDLSRKEMAHLYRLVAEDPALTVEMGQLGRMQEQMFLMAESLDELRPGKDLTAEVMTAFKADQRENYSVANLSKRFLDWMFSPKGLAVQPFSFAGGVLATFMLVSLAVPTLRQAPSSSLESVSTRLDVHDVQFVNAKARVDWTNQFIIPPGASTRLALDEGREPVQIQFETVEPTRLTLTHLSIRREEETTRSFVVNGIGYATLRQPRTGDAVSILNGGQVPVLVYMRNAGGVTVSGFSDRADSRSL